MKLHNWIPIWILAAMLGMYLGTASGKQTQTKDWELECIKKDAIIFHIQGRVEQYQDSIKVLKRQVHTLQLK